jgi:nucleotide-binding universal stress UspA family protein
MQEIPMVYRSVLVHLDDDPRCDARVDLAARIAVERDARLVGLAPTGWLEGYASVPSPLGGEQLALASAALRECAEALAVRFRERCKAVPLRAVAAFVDEAAMSWSVVAHGHGHDLIVLGQPTPQHLGHRRARAELEQVVLHASRPVLVVPYAGSLEPFGRNVLIAWNGSREAARAAADAMPLLTAAREVHLVEFRRPIDADEPGTADLQAALEWLRWHGVEAHSRLEVSEIDVGNALLSRANDLGADLVVMGAFTHARWTERVLGGATRSLLEQMTVPVLMSH